MQLNDSSAPSYLTVRTLAEREALSEYTVRDYLKAGHYTGAEKRGTRWRVRADYRYVGPSKMSGPVPAQRQKPRTIAEAKALLAAHAQGR